MSPAELSALRAIRDCGVIRARAIAPGFHQLQLRGLVRPDRIVRGGHYARADFRLTRAGQRAAVIHLDGGTISWRGRSRGD